jgi:hypothetical protein
VIIRCRAVRLQILLLPPSGSEPSLQSTSPDEIARLDSGGLLPSVSQPPFRLRRQIDPGTNARSRDSPESALVSPSPGGTTA